MYFPRVSSLLQAAKSAILCKELRDFLQSLQLKLRECFEVCYSHQLLTSCVCIPRDKLHLSFDICLQTRISVFILKCSNQCDSELTCIGQGKTPNCDIYLLDFCSYKDFDPAAFCQLCY